MKKIHSILIISFFLSPFVVNAQSFWTANGTHIYNNNTGNVGIGTTTPNYKLAVNGQFAIVTSDFDPGTNTGSSLVLNTGATTGNTYTFLQGQSLGNSAFGNISLNPYGGNVGIGTTTPASKLEVTGTIAAIGGNLIVQNTSPDYAMYNSSAGTNEKIWDQTSDASAMAFRAVNDSFTDATTYMQANRTGTIINSIIFPNGKLGIGTTNPTSLLSIGNGAAYRDMGLTVVSNNGYGFTSFFQTSPTSSGVGIANISGVPAIQAMTDSGATANIALQTLGGNVGIGTATPDELLAVNGIIHTQEVKVDLDGWEDRVFKPTYRLPLLSSVRNYIDLNHHLPDMPSEQEIVKNGLKLGEMEKTLTKKVEELTLYLIEKDRQLAQVQKDLETQATVNRSTLQQLDELNRQMALFVAK